MGAGGSERRRKPHGRCGDADLYTCRVGCVCVIPGGCVPETEAEEDKAGGDRGDIKKIISLDKTIVICRRII